MAREDGPSFVRWREEFVSQERGSRVVHYYLDDDAGGSHLAVVGTERSLRHMLYVVSEDFRAAWGCGVGADDGGGPAAVFARKWRSRREVVDFLASFLPVKAALDSKFSKCRSSVDNDIGLDGYSETDCVLHQNLGKDCSSDITWSGPFWTCGKQLRHYQAFCRNGTTISTHTFVLVLSEEESRYLAYLEDMYEDKKGQKKVKETVPASTLAHPDKLGLRSPYRLRIRPRPRQNSYVNGAALIPGTAIDVWQFSGWWEGIIVSLDNTAADSLQVYFPGENFFRVCQLQKVRISKDWVKNQWVDIEIRTDVLSQIPLDGAGTRQPDNLSSVRMLDSSSSGVPEQELPAIQGNSCGDKPVLEQGFVATQANSSGEKPVPEQGLAATQASSNGDKPVPEQGLVATQASSNGDKPVLEKGLPAIQAASTEDKQTEVSKQAESSLTDKTSSVVVEDEKQTILGKRPRDTEQDCKEEVGVDVGKT
nr:unnamed protein product [Digitaria exilis]